MAGALLGAAPSPADVQDSSACGGRRRSGIDRCSPHQPVLRSAASRAVGHGWSFHSLLLNSSPGPGIASTVKTGEEVGFVVDAKTAGKGKVTCTVLTPDGTEAEADVIENEDGTYDIFYTAAKPGTYVIYVRFGGVDIPNSPFTVMVRKMPSLERSAMTETITAAIC